MSTKLIKKRMTKNRIDFLSFYTICNTSSHISTAADALAATSNKLRLKNASISATATPTDAEIMLPVEENTAGTVITLSTAKGI